MRRPIPASSTMPRRGSARPRISTAELFIALTGAKMTHVPYRGTGPALNDIVAGHVDLIFMELSSADEAA